MDKSIIGKWTYSYNEENFYSEEHFDTKDEAIEYGKAEYKNEDYYKFYVGKVKEYTPRICALSIVEDIAEDAYEFNEYAEDYLENVDDDMVDDLNIKLNDVLQEWLNKYNLQPNFYSIVSISEIKIDEESEEML